MASGEVVELAQPSHWEGVYDVHVLDPDGWRRGAPLGERDWTDPITSREFLERASISTVTRLSPEAWRLIRGDGR